MAKYDLLYFLVMRIFFLIICFSFYQLCLAQDKFGHQWLFLNNNNIIFHEDSVEIRLIPIGPPYFNSGSYATNMCNKNGDLLFYTGGCYVLNNEHEMMVNGDSITSNFALQNWCGSNDFPFRQNNTILPFPNDTNRYVVFNNNIENPLGSSGVPIPTQLYYHIVDMTQDSGRGAIVQKKQVILEDTLTRGYLQATRHANGIDWWVVAPEWNSGCYFVVPLTALGVGTFHRSCAGQIWGDGGGGQVTFSPNGNKYVQCNYTNGLWVFDFENVEGVLSNPLELTFPTPASNYRGVCFSPNSRFLYVSSQYQLFQFDMEAEDIQASMQLVGELDLSMPIQGGGSLAFSKLGPNGKIYIAGPGNHYYLSVVNKPNCPGLACDFKKWDLMLLESNYGGLPNLPHFTVPNQTYECGSISTESPINKDILEVYPNPTARDINMKSSSEGEIEFQLFDPMGRLVKTGNINGKATRSISLEELPSGIYYLYFWVDSKRNVQKIIKM